MRTPKSQAEWRMAMAFLAAEAGGNQACIPLRDVAPLLEEVHDAHFDRRYGDITWQFSVQRSLANINREKRHIRLHYTLNWHDVPDAVFRMIFFHELLHLEVPPGTNDEGLPDPHPPAFWEAEKARNPHLDEGWGWLKRNLLLEDQRVFECTGVVPKRVRLTQAQRDWIAEQTGVSLPRSIRIDEPMLRTRQPGLWMTVLIAKWHEAPKDS